MVKNPSPNAGGTGSIPEPGRSPAVGNGNSLQYSCLGNRLDRGTWSLKKSVRTEQLSTDQYMKYMIVESSQ